MENDKKIQIWEPIEFDDIWLQTDTSKLDDLSPSWYKKRASIQENDEEYNEFINRLKRQHAIETGIVEKLYDLSDGITETFIKEGFVESFISHDDTNIPPHKLMGYLNSHFQALDFIFDVVKNDRPLTKSFIKELHQLITEHQDSANAIDSLGNYVQVQLLKGEFKKNENNPRREDRTVFMYCPPVQVENEMENLLTIYNDLQKKEENPVIISAWIHHAFTKIHPFQDGNGRIARLLSSLVLIKAGLFPFTVKRTEKIAYIKALEGADKGSPNALVIFFSEVQKRSIENALNYKLEKSPVSITEIAQLFNQKVDDLRSEERKKRIDLLDKNRGLIFKFLDELVGKIKNELCEVVPIEKAKINIKSIKPENKDHFWYNKQIAEYASKHDYYFNKLLPRGWFRFSFSISEDKRYDLIITVHHYSYDDSVMAIGSFLEFVSQESPKDDKKKIDNTTTIQIPLKPYTISLEFEADIGKLKINIENYVRDIVKIGLTVITNELI